MIKIRHPTLCFSLPKAELSQSQYRNEKGWKIFIFHWIHSVYLGLMISPNALSTLTDSQAAIQHSELLDVSFLLLLTDDESLKQ